MYFQRRRGSQVVIYYRAADRKLKTVPRHYIKHLDLHPDHNIKAWIEEHAPQWEAAEGVPRAVALGGSDVPTWIVEWAEYRLKRAYGTLNTVTRAAHALREDVAPYFFSFDPPLVDPNKWPAVSFGLVEWQEKQGISEANRIHAKTALRKWWKWLGDTRRILPGVDLPLDTPRRTAQATSLSYTLTPEQVLEFARTTSGEAGLMALLGYFASLRPQELFSLRRGDFYSGKAVEDRECCLVMAKYGYFSRLAVDIQRQRRKLNVFAPPKSFSKGLVAIFNEQAAVMIRERILEFDREALLFPASPGWEAEMWKRHGIPDLTLHDLRKASIYWLGHYGGLDLIPLKNHARHSKVETTMLYCRRPLEQAGEQDQDLAW